MECFNESEEQLEYEIKEKIERQLFYTRNEIKKRNYILKELNIVYKEKDKDKLNYLFKEEYGNKRLSFENKYLKLKNDLSENYTSKFNSLYEILKLTYTKK